MSSATIAPLGWLERRFGACLAVIGGGALALRVVFVTQQRWDLPLRGDAFFFYWQARLLSTGHGFINSAAYQMVAVTRQSADHPPLFTLYLSALDLVGLRSPNLQLLTHCVIGTGTVVVLALVGRRIGGALVGLVTAVIAATYPPLWVNDGMLLSESLFLLLLSAALFTIYRAWESRATRDLVWSAVLIGLATLVRAEALLLVPLVLVPMAVRVTTGESRARRARLVIGSAALAMLIVSPWVLFNIARFEQPMYLSADGVTWAAANCDSTYHGQLLGYYDLGCVHTSPVDISARARYLRTSDAGVENAKLRSDAFRYMRDHVGELPGVVLARVGRLWQLTRVHQTQELDITVEGRDRFAVTTGYWYTYALMPLSVVGGVLLFRRRVPIIPLVMPIGIATLSAAIAFGVLRYRAIAEPSLVLLGAVAIAAALNRGRNLSRSRSAMPS